MLILHVSSVSQLALDEIAVLKECDLAAIRELAMDVVAFVAKKIDGLHNCSFSSFAPSWKFSG